MSGNKRKALSPPKDHRRGPGHSSALQSTGAPVFGPFSQPSTAFPRHSGSWSEPQGTSSPSQLGPQAACSSPQAKPHVSPFSSRYPSATTSSPPLPQPKTPSLPPRPPVWAHPFARPQAGTASLPPQPSSKASPSSRAQSGTTISLPPLSPSKSPHSFLSHPATTSSFPWRPARASSLSQNQQQHHEQQ
jgi:hypothetical protein